MQRENMCNKQKIIVMKKIVLLLTGVALLLSSCGTYTGQGAYMGGSFGSILGSAIGGISGGWRGHEVGKIVGMAGGAVVGAAIGAAADQKAAERVEDYRQQKAAQRDYDNRRSGYGNYDNSGFDSSNSADDRIDFDGAGPRDGHGRYSAAKPRTFDPTKSTVAPGYNVRYNESIEIRNARIVDADRDGVIRAGEECKVTFEIMNHSDKILYDVQPTVLEVSGNKRIYISPNLHVESIAPHSGVRYTATVKADRKLKDGQAVIRVAVAQGHREITSQVEEFVVETRRK